MEHYHTLSMIEEATEASDNDWRSSRPSQVERPPSQDTPGFIPGHGNTHSVQRISILSSETSYGEVLPPGQATLGQSGLGLFSWHDKDLPSVPAVRSVSGRSAASAKAERSPIPSLAKTKSSRHSLAKSDVSSLSGTGMDVPEIASEAQFGPGQSPRSAQKPTSPPTIPSDQKSQSSQSTVRSNIVPQSPRSSSRSSRNTEFELLIPKESSVNYSNRSKSKKSYAPSEHTSGSSRTQSPVEFAPTAQSPSHKKSRSISSSSAGGSILTSSTITRSEIPAPQVPAPYSSLDTQSSVSKGSSTQSSLRTFDDVVDEVAASLALRTKMHAETVTIGNSEQIKVGVCTTMSRSEDQAFVEVLASKIHHVMALHSSYLFAICPSVIGMGGTATLAFCGAPQRLVTKASILAGLRFKTRLAELQDLDGTWIGCLDPRPGIENWEPIVHDEDVLWDIIRKAASSISPSEPPAGSRGIERRLIEARTRLDRLSPAEAYREAIQDSILVDIRPESQRLVYGCIPGALIIERNDLEWSFDPRSNERLPIADRYDLRIIVYDQDGVHSSLAAASLQDIGLWRATDVVGGYSRWQREGFPTTLLPDDELTEEN